MKKTENTFGPRIHKVTVNMGVGEAGQKLDQAHNILERLTGQKPVETLSMHTIREWNLRKNLPIGTVVTLRKEKAMKFLKNAFGAVENKINEKSFDKEGNISFGIKEHIEFPGERYDSKIGIYGMDVCIAFERVGHRIKRRKRMNRKLPQKVRLTKDETKEYLETTFNVKVIS